MSISLTYREYAARRAATRAVLLHKTSGFLTHDNGGCCQNGFSTCVDQIGLDLAILAAREHQQTCSQKPRLAEPRSGCVHYGNMITMKVVIAAG